MVVLHTYLIEFSGKEVVGALVLDSIGAYSTTEGRWGSRSGICHSHTHEDEVHGQYLIDMLYDRFWCGVALLWCICGVSAVWYVYMVWYDACMGL